MSDINIQHYKTEIGDMIIGSYEGELCLLDFRHRKMRKAVDERVRKGFDAVFVEKSDYIIEETKKQITAYLCGERKEFDVPVITVGTDFQKRVWRALTKIPYGQTISYLELAQNINNEKAVRAVANANGANAIGIIIPCHRVIQSSGELGGYGGGVEVKQVLLDLETCDTHIL